MVLQFSRFNKLISKTLLLAFVVQMMAMTVSFGPSVASASTLARAGDVVINEINWAGSSKSIADEWIELKNTTNQEIDISNWTLEGVTSNGGDLILPALSSIPALDYFLISNFSNINNSSNLDIIPNYVDTDISLSNSGQSKNILLTAEDATVIDEALATTWSKGKSSPETSMVRIDNSKGAEVGGWADSFIAINLKDLSTDKGSPKAVNTDTQAPTVTISDDRGSLDNYVIPHQLVEITATFTDNDQIDESLGAKPKITIGGDSEKLMTKSDNKTWTYNWMVTEPSGPINIQINAQDRSENKVSGSISYYVITQLDAGISQELNSNVEITTQSDGYILFDNVANPEALPATDKSVGGVWRITDVSHLYDKNLFDGEKVTLRVYFTQAELDEQGITDPKKQIEGLYNYSEGSWKLYGENKVVVGEHEGDIVFSGITYAGYVESVVDHFNDFTIVAHTMPPVAPSGVGATYSNGKLKISWKGVAGAVGYKVRIGTTSDPSTFVWESDILAPIITEIEHSVDAGKKYFIFVYTIGFGSLPSSASTPFSITITGAEEPEIVYAVATPEPVSPAVTTPSESVSTPKETITPTPTETGEVKSDENTDDSSTNRIMVTIIILILAAGAGIGGYYGYLWWQEKNQEEEALAKKTVKQPQTTKSKTKSSSTSKGKSTRW